ncbi:MAG: hypothetical protein LBR15_00935 [Methanobrevibacter sp.]|jgi:hypothetical protein|nr:hypothetical protein [Candidatus Methanovirga australis]
MWRDNISNKIITKSVIRRNNPKASTITSKIPLEVKKTLNLEIGDHINWIIEAVDNNLQVRIEKVEEEE